MKTVKIIAGGYGYRANAKSPSRLILAGDFVCLDDAEAERLMEQGIAVCMDQMAEKTEQPELPGKPVRKRNRKTTAE